MRLLHVGPNRGFTQFLVQVFEDVAPGENEMLLLSDLHTVAADFPFHFVPTTAIKQDPDGYAVALEMAQRADVVIAHGMSDFPARLTTEPSVTATFVWSGWGYDYYLEHLHPERYHGPLSLPFALRGPITSTPEGREWAAGWHRLLHQAAGRTAYFSAPIPADFEVFRAEFPSFAGSYRQLNYGDVQSTFAPQAATASGRNILVGNSSTTGNNHLEIFQTLSELDLADRSLVVPLAYGNDAHAEEVIQVGTRLFGEQFAPITDYMPLDDYVRLISSCTTAVFGHKRQQAVGNVGTVLHQGSHVYMDLASPLAGWLREQGADIHSLAELDRVPPDDPVDDEVLVRHRQLLQRHWDHTVVERNVRALTDELRRTDPTSETGRSEFGRLGRRLRRVLRVGSN